VSLGASTISTVEGNAGTHNVQVPVSLTNPSTFPITVHYTTANSSATAPSDYASASGTLTIPANSVVANIPVTVNGDNLDETNETFTVLISSPGGGGSVPPILGNASQTVTITNDDTPTVSVSNAVIDTQEMNSGTHTVPVTVTLSNPSVVGITVTYSTAAGTAVTPSDFVATAGTVTFAAGQTSKSFNVSVKGDTALEDYEFFTVGISSPTPAATAPTVLGNATEPIQILNDEKPSLTGTNVSGVEGSVLQFGATLVQRYYQPITVGYVTSNATAIAPGDYVLTTGTISFAAGTKGTQTVGVQTNFDFQTEVAETFKMNWTSTSIKASPVIKTGTIKSNHT
jgi:chitinase